MYTWAIKNNRNKQLLTHHQALRNSTLPTLWNRPRISTLLSPLSPRVTTILSCVLNIPLLFIRTLVRIRQVMYVFEIYICAINCVLLSHAFFTHYFLRFIYVDAQRYGPFVSLLYSIPLYILLKYIYIYFFFLHSPVNGQLSAFCVLYLPAGTRGQSIPWSLESVFT